MTAHKVSSGLTSIIVATYNRPDALRRVLLELDRQSVDAFEVVVADDGSSGETADTIAGLRDRVGYRLKHAWQEDEGFRLARIRNLAVLESEGDYLIFLDGDCIPLKGFAEDHRWLAEPGWWVRGTRVDLRKEFTERLLREELTVTEWPFVRWALAYIRGESARTAPFIRLGTQRFRKRSPRKVMAARGCNLGIWRDDYMRVDGFGRKEGRYLVPVVHLWHPLASQSSQGTNDGLLNEAIRSGSTRARLGISSHDDNRPSF
jgi:glycosyltransferase involved in cell wall biosynthesis